MTVSRAIVARYAFALLISAGALASVTIGARAAEDAERGPFAGLSGSWSGDGTVTMSNGSSERIRCRASYSVPPMGKQLNQGLQCASDSYRFNVTSNVFSEGGALRGTWSESTNQVSGDVTGRITPGVIETNVSSPVFSAHLSVVTKGSRQSVSILPQGTDVRTVTIEMRRG